MNKIFKYGIAAIVLCCAHTSTLAQTDKNWKSIVKRKDLQWFATDSAKAIADNVLLYQRDIGGWPKNIQMQNKLTDSEKQALQQKKKEADGCTTDNGATIQELTFLFKVNSQVPDARYKTAIEKGLDYLLAAQYPNGGWPQFYPRSKGYYTHITFNDDSMVNIMKLLRDVLKKKDFYVIDLSPEKTLQLQTAFDKGVDCILKCQYVQNGVLTGWCAQHDENTLLPANARAYELASLSGQESAGIVLFLMSLSKPSPEIIKAVDSAVKWFEKTKITGYRVEWFVNAEGKKDKRLVEDANAAPIWARFMELGDNTPFFCDRDGIKKPAMADIGFERRTGYQWYDTSPNDAIAKYPQWQQKNSK
jgi:pectinesterase